jgi:hypothetical protein
MVKVLPCIEEKNEKGAAQKVTSSKREGGPEKNDET